MMTMAYGLSGAPSNYSHAMTRHNHRFGTTPEDFAHIAVVTRRWATLNPRAVMHSLQTHPQGGPITIEDVNSARIISWPLTLLHCCLVTDYGGAVLITSPEIARSLKTKPVWIAGAGENMSHSNMLEMGDFTATSAAASGAAAYKMAGMGPEDDWLSVAIGNIHGAISGAARDAKKLNARLNLEHLERISEVTGVPLVLHGGSGIEKKYVLGAFKRGIAKINVGTAIRQPYEVASKESVAAGQKAVYEATVRVLIEELELAGSAQRVNR